MRTILSGTLALSLLLVSGCGSGATSVREILGENCRQAHRCRASWSGPFEFETLYGEDEGACVVLYASIADAIDAAIADGRTRYDGERAASCAERQRALRCEALWTGDALSECELVLVGTQPDGAPCELGTECSGARCIDGLCASR